MSKSVGNLVTIAEALEKFGGDALRMFVISSHYRSPSTYTEDALDAARSGVERLRKAAFAESTGDQIPTDFGELRGRFKGHMDNDMNTPQALAVAFDLSKIINRGIDRGQNIKPAQALLRELCGVLGFTLSAAPKSSQEAAPFVDLLVAMRTELRAAKQWQLADRVRDGLLELGIEIMDSADGTTWTSK
jgi:cysteinyl-tRNA synthetase